MLIYADVTQLISAVRNYYCVNITIIIIQYWGNTYMYKQSNYRVTCMYLVCLNDTGKMLTDDVMIPMRMKGDGLHKVPLGWQNS